MSRGGINLSQIDAGAIEESIDDPLVGTALGSYELVGRIGAGDLGVVCRAYHRLLGQERADLRVREQTTRVGPFPC